MMKNLDKDVTLANKLVQNLNQKYNFLAGNEKALPINSGFAFPTFKLVGFEGIYFLKILRGINDDELMKTSIIFEELHKHEFPTCFPLRNISGNYLSDINGNHILLFPYVDIEVPTFNSETLRRIGALLAKLHLTNFSKKPDSLRKLSLRSLSRLSMCSADIFIFL